ncbi:MAG: hypothetical protein M3277_08675 [Actinomycetota bacterium]|nr:hypothetical protein [Actinomycetota bacterium]
MRHKAVAAVALLACFLSARPAQAQESCSRVVVFTLPSVTWSDVARYRPTSLLAAIEQGAAASLSVRTNSARTSYASGFATIGAGSRVDGGRTTGGIVGDESGETIALVPDVRAAGVEEMRDLAEGAGYSAVPGALGDALGSIPSIAIGNSDLALDPPVPLGYGRWALLAAMDATGVVDLAGVDNDVLLASREGLTSDPVAMTTLVDAALENGCAVTVIDPGDLIRADTPGIATASSWSEALASADELLGLVMERLDSERDLLLIASPTSPSGDPTTHFGIAVAVGPGFEPGDALNSGSTRRAGIVTLPGIAPTVLSHLDIERPAMMLGRPWVGEPTSEDRLSSALELDRESGFVDRVRAPIFTGFVLAELLVYGAIAYLLWRGRRKLGRISVSQTALEAAALALLAFPLATFLMGTVSAHELGRLGYPIALVGVTGAVLGAAWIAGDDARARVLWITVSTAVVLLVDLVTGSHLQLNTVFSYSPLVAGRFSGIGNIGFAVLGAAVVIASALMVDRWGRNRRILIAVAVLFLATVAIDGAPAFGSDVGGVLTFVPAFTLTWVLLSGRRPSWRSLLLGAVGAVVVVGAFIAWDLSLPEDSRTHLGRFFEDVRGRGAEVFNETIVRKLRANFRVFTSTIWTYLVPPLLVFVGWLLLRPPGRWAALEERFPAIRAGILGGLIVAVLGFAVNDSGIVVPAVVLSMLVPVALVTHLQLERESSP